MKGAKNTLSFGGEETTPSSTPGLYPDHAQGSCLVMLKEPCGVGDFHMQSIVSLLS